MTIELGRRDILGGLVGAAATTAIGGAADVVQPGGSRDPDLGPNVFIFDPAMPAAAMQAQLKTLFRQQERAHFTDRRYAVLLKPGRYKLDVNVGFFTQVAGLGLLPGYVMIDGHVHAEADWNKGKALVNFWRAAENVTVRPPDRLDRWAVSQAAPYRRMHLAGDLALDDGGYSSGGFMADCRVDGMIRSGSQQQWYTRSTMMRGWEGANWNMMFMGVDGAPASTFPNPANTTLSAVPLIREKPFLLVDGSGSWHVFVPALRRDARGTSWASGLPEGGLIPLDRFFIAREGMTAAQINAGLDLGLNLLLTPGIYRLTEPLRVQRAGTVVLGLGLATLLAQGGAKAMTVADVSGVTIAGLLIDAGPVNSPVLMEVGPRESSADHAANPTLLSDVFFRLGGAAVGNAETCLEVNSHHVIGDHLWIWRGDHGDRTTGRVHVGWDESRGAQGLVVNGDDVTLYGLFVEHFQKYQTVWNGERGRTFFYQNELPYDPPSQARYMAGATRGWAAYKVADSVRTHEAIGMGIYSNFTSDPSIVLENAIEAPRTPGVRFSNVTTISLGGAGTIQHLVNGVGATARRGSVRQTLVRYPPARNVEP